MSPKKAKRSVDESFSDDGENNIVCSQEELDKVRISLDTIQEQIDGVVSQIEQLKDNLATLEGDAARIKVGIAQARDAYQRFTEQQQVIEMSAETMEQAVKEDEPDVSEAKDVKRIEALMRILTRKHALKVVSGLWNCGAMATRELKVAVFGQGKSDKILTVLTDLERIGIVTRERLVGKGRTMLCAISTDFTTELPMLLKYASRLPGNVSDPAIQCFKTDIEGHLRSLSPVPAKQEHKPGGCEDGKDRSKQASRSGRSATESDRSASQAPAKKSGVVTRKRRSSTAAEVEPKRDIATEDAPDQSRKLDMQDMQEAADAGMGFGPFDLRKAVRIVVPAEPTRAGLIEFEKTANDGRTRAERIAIVEEIMALPKGEKEKVFEREGVSTQQVVMWGRFYKTSGLAIDGIPEGGANTDTGESNGDDVVEDEDEGLMNQFPNGNGDVVESEVKRSIADISDIIFDPTVSIGESLEKLYKTSADQHGARETHRMELLMSMSDPGRKEAEELSALARRPADQDEAHQRWRALYFRRMGISGEFDRVHKRFASLLHQSFHRDLSVLEKQEIEDIACELWGYVKVS